MTPATQTTTPTIVPTFSYSDAPRAIEWLRDAFGFEPGEVHEGPENTIAHAELWLGNGLIMLGSVKDESPWQVPPGVGATYVLITDPDGHYERAKAAGATIVMELTNQDYGSREYAARDLEGNLWSFGTYAPQRGR